VRCGFASKSLQSPAVSFFELAQRVPKSYQKRAENSAVELGRLLDIDAAGRVHGRQNGSGGRDGEVAIQADELLSFLTTRRKSTIR
jgi:hypothetical protein